jgi:hypothetical protein
MPDLAGEPESLAARLAALPCAVNLPPTWAAHFEQRGTAPATSDDRRRFPRFLCRDLGSRAGVSYVASFPSLERDSALTGAYVCDLSRGGLRLLHAEPVFPKERLRVVLAQGGDVTGLLVEVMHCRRIGPRCFQVGARFVT